MTASTDIITSPLPVMLVDPDSGNPYKTVSGTVTVAATATTGTDRSAATSVASSTLMAANTSRKGFEVVNDTAIDVWINYGAVATAVAGSGNRKIAAGTRYESPANSFVYSGVISIIAASGTPAITAREY